MDLQAYGRQDPLSKTKLSKNRSKNVHRPPKLSRVVPAEPQFIRSEDSKCIL